MSRAFFDLRDDGHRRIVLIRRWKEDEMWRDVATFTELNTARLLLGYIRDGESHYATPAEREADGLTP